jgi:signal transduction histidine kinase
MSAADAPNERSYPGPTPGKPLTRERIERLSSRIITGFSVVFGVQVIPVFLEQYPHLRSPWGLITAAVMLGVLGCVVAAAVAQRLLRTSQCVFVVCYVITLVAWPAIANVEALASSRPWPWYLCNVATAYAALGMTLIPASVFTIGIPVLYGVVRALTGGPDAWETAALDTVYAFVLGGVILVIVTMLRQAASAVDKAQAAALQRYAAVVREHAHESERVQVDALVHDSVLTTLLAAAAADTDETKAVAVRMARDTLGHLDTTAPEAGETSAIGFDRLRERIRSASRSFSCTFAFTAPPARELELPMSVAEALYSATVQAMVNSAQHAGGGRVKRQVRIAVAPDGAVTIDIIDDGAGFDPATVPPERLGITVSIRERVTRAGGSVTVLSHPGDGTTVRLVWPRSGQVAP